MYSDCFSLTIVNFGTNGIFEFGVGTVAFIFFVNFKGHVDFMLAKLKNRYLCLSVK